MFAYDFMVNAFAAAGLVALVAGLAGYLLVLRGQTFAGHALGHVGFTGATGAVLIGVAPLWGLLAVTIAAGVLMGLVGERLAGRDVAVGVVLAAALGIGLLFLHFFTSGANEATSILFGNVLGVDRATVWALAGLTAIALAGFAVIARPLLFATLQPEIAAARGVGLRLVAVLFLAIVALVTAQCVQIVGVLLVFALMVGPAAAAQRLTARLLPGLALAALLAVAEAWGGLVAAYYTDWPTSFWIVAFSTVVFLASARAEGLRRE
ncbi:MAG TPA: metal ABC transporter permease [Acetobacteraceae bacterium]|nr:metal ABC transporter permease [Acetobacteraceae bacterium]